MLYREYAAAPDLGDVVASYWRFALDPSTPPVETMHTVPPDGTVTLCWLPFGMATIVGPRMKALRVPVKSGLEYIGIRLRPGVAGPLLGINVAALREQVVAFQRPDFAEVARSFTPERFDHLVREWCAAAGWQGPDPVVDKLAARIIDSDGTAPVSVLTSGFDLGYRQILRRFYNATGLTPKEFARLRRIRAACLRTLEASAPGWAGVAAAAGFADQAHMVREFQDVFGWPPRLVHAYLSRIEHQDLAP
jgi:AraC-like DNA-binding protein